MKTFSLKNKVERKWHLIDLAQANSFGRVATTVCTLLRGKHKPIYTPNMDCGDYVVVINSNSMKITGKKLKQKIYYSYTGYPGGLVEKSITDLGTEKSFLKSVERMLPRNKLRIEFMKRLLVYGDANHKHSAQMPVLMGVK